MIWSGTVLLCQPEPPLTKGYYTKVGYASGSPTHCLPFSAYDLCSYICPRPSIPSPGTNIQSRFSKSHRDGRSKKVKIPRLEVCRPIEAGHEPVDATRRSGSNCGFDWRFNFNSSFPKEYRAFGR